MTPESTSSLSPLFFDSCSALCRNTYAKPQNRRILRRSKAPHYPWSFSSVRGARFQEDAASFRVFLSGPHALHPRQATHHLVSVPLIMMVYAGLRQSGNGHGFSLLMVQFLPRMVIDHTKTAYGRCTIGLFYGSSTWTIRLVCQPRLLGQSGQSYSLQVAQKSRSSRASTCDLHPSSRSATFLLLHLSFGEFQFKTGSIQLALPFVGSCLKPTNERLDVLKLLCVERDYVLALGNILLWCRRNLALVLPLRCDYFFLLGHVCFLCCLLRCCVEWRHHDLTGKEGMPTRQRTMAPPSVRTGHPRLNLQRLRSSLLVLLCLQPPVQQFSLQLHLPEIAF
jgi:hypothetical protein